MEGEGEEVEKGGGEEGDGAAPLSLSTVPRRRSLFALRLECHPIERERQGRDSEERREEKMRRYPLKEDTIAPLRKNRKVGIELTFSLAAISYEKERRREKEEEVREVRKYLTNGFPPSLSFSCVAFSFHDVRSSNTENYTK